MEGDANEIQQQIEQRISELPQDIQSAILSSDFGQKIQEIGTAAKLHIDQSQQLNDITMLVMLGFMPMDEFDGEMAKQLNINQEATKKIASDINAQIFLPIRESMKRFAREGSTPPVATPTSPPAHAPLSSVLPLSSVTPPPAMQAPISAPIAPVIAEMKPSSPVIPASPAAPDVPKLEMHPADLMLTEKTVVTTPTSPVTPPAAAAPAVAKPAETNVEPPKPQDYKADPYREPIS